MFLLSRKTKLALLISIIGILKPAEGLKCYACEPCGSNKELGTIRECHPLETYCSWGERELENGTRFGIRFCATAAFAESDSYSCDKFMPRRPNPKEKLRVCSCQEDLCNDDDTSGGTYSSSSQPLCFLIFLSISIVVFFNLISLRM